MLLILDPMEVKSKLFTNPVDYESMEMKDLEILAMEKLLQKQNIPSQHNLLFNDYGHSSALDQGYNSSLNSKAGNSNDRRHLLKLNLNERLHVCVFQAESATT